MPIINNLPQGGVESSGRKYLIKDGILNSDINVRQTSFSNAGRAQGTFQYESSLKALVTRKNAGEGHNYQPVVEYSFNSQNGYSKFCIELENELPVGAGSFMLEFIYGSGSARHTLQYHPINAKGGCIHITKEKMVAISNLNYMKFNLRCENRQGYLAIKNIWLEK